METDEPQAAPLSRPTSTRATTAASLGLAGVVICLAAFSIFAAYTTRIQVDRAQHEEDLHGIYGEAITAIRAEESAEQEYLLGPSPQSQAALGQATNAMFNAINDFEARGGAEEARLAKDVLVLHDTYVVASARLIAAVTAGDAAEARRIDREEVDPVFDAMHERITQTAEAHETEAAAAFVALHNTARWVLVESPVIFTIGFALLLGLWRILDGYHRATRETYREIEQLSQLRSEFVSIVSHEFRTPLTGIQGFSEMMRDEELTPAQMREYAGDINKDARRLARLITDMLDLDRMESGRMTLNSEPVDFNGIVTEAAAPFRLSAADHPIELDLDGRLPLLRGDADRLTQVVNNLVSNAMKYSPNGGVVELRTRRSEKTLTLTVRDHGVGIPADHLEAIFDRYSRVLTPETRSVPGTGLGLPIVRQIVQLCEGRVWATSEPGQGSVFHVELPLVEATPLEALAAAG